MSQDRASWLSTATVLFFIWSFLSLCVRVWVKLGRKHKWGVDDSAISAAFAVALIHVAAIFWAIHYGYGQPFDSIPESHKGDVGKALYGSQLSYVVSLGLTKMSTAFFIGHLSRYAPHFRISYILAASSGLWTVASTILIALRGNLLRPWATYDGSEAMYVRWIAIEAVGLVVEVALWGYSIDIVWGLQMRISKRILILCAFACRLLLIPIIAIRLFYLSPSKNSDPTFTSILPSIFTEASLEYCIISASVTCLKPFLRPFHSDVVDAIPSADSSLRSGIRAKTLKTYMLGLISTADQNGTTRSTTKRSCGPLFGSKGGKTAPPIQTLFQPNQLHGHTVNSAWSDAHRHEIESIRSVGSDHMIIRTTKNWSIQYEEG